ncbi:MAG: hypothetical protein ACK5O4_00380 [bacterium]|jgi:hypothetical protein
MWDIRDIIYGFFMGQPSPFGLSSEIIPFAAEANPYVVAGSFSLTGILAGAGECWEEICQGVFGEALLELLQKAGNGMQAARSTAGNVMQSASSSITNTMNRMANLRMQQLASQRA